MLLLFLPILFSLILSSTCDCPPEEDIGPFCFCKDLGDGPMMLCSNIMSTEELIPLIKSTDSYDMFALTLIDSSLLYIPNQLFRNTKYQKIRFANTHIMSLSDTDLAFIGLEDSLEEIRATDAHYITQWDWSQLRNQRRLDLIDIHLISMYSVNQEFPPLKSLKTLGISKAEISFIHSTAFRGLENLYLFIMPDNLITEMYRSMLPYPANQLYKIDLRGNLLSSLPEDMFEAMPNLRELDLSYNRFATLNEDTFLWPLENLQLVMLTGNEFRCDCRLKWIVDVQKPLYFEGNCTHPEDMNGIPLSYLARNYLWCL